jgi:aminoacrylate peracid reductase
MTQSPSGRPEKITKARIRTRSIEPMLRPCSAGIMVDDVLYISGTHSIDDNGHVVGPGDIVQQTVWVIQKLIVILGYAGGSLKDITFNQIVLSSMTDYECMNNVYCEHFGGKCPPARSCICADLVKPEYLVEIASIAHIKNVNWTRVT